MTSGTATTSGSLITMISSGIFEVAGQDSMVKGLVLLLSFIGIILLTAF